MKKTQRTVGWKKYAVIVENAVVQLLINTMSDQDAYSLMNAASLPQTTHTHAYTELFFCTSGSISIQTDTEILQIFDGEAAFIPANIQHVKLELAASGTFFTIGLALTQRTTQNCSDLYHLLNRLCTGNQPLIFKNQWQLCHVAEEILELSDVNPSMPCLPALRLTLLLSETAGKLSKQSTGIGMSNEQAFGNPEHFLQLEYIIDSSYMFDLTVESMAKQLFLSKRQLSRVVKQRYGTTLKQLITAKRLTAAQSLLLQTNKTITEIGREVGYFTPSSFYYEFRHHYGVSPTQYRQQYKASDAEPSDLMNAI